ncbi:hypothetical protein ABPG72_017800 [Tetrahymena utriculariae]
MDSFSFKALQAISEIDPTEMFFQRMYRVCFKYITPTTQQIDQDVQKQLENCYLRYYKTYKIVCEEAHKYEDDFDYGDDEDDDDNNGQYDEDDYYD